MYLNNFVTMNVKLASSVSLNYFASEAIVKLAVQRILSRKKCAFTLAETLITLTIIGVIAAMTVPTLVTNYHKHTYVVGLKKAYSQLSNAIKMIPISENCSAGSYECAGMNLSSGTIWPNSLLSKQLKGTALKSSFSRDKGCLGYDCFMTADGMTISHSNGIYVDINGAKGPNKWGRDLFKFYIAPTTENDVQQGTLMPYGSKLYAKYANDSNYYWKNNKSSPLCTASDLTKSLSYQYPFTGSESRGFESCAGRVLEEGKMNY